MKAWVLHEVNDLRFENVDLPQIEATEVLVQVKAAGICGSDIPRIFQTGAHKHPLIPGHEFAGEVVEIGGDVKNWWKGKRVGIFPLIPCKKCSQCRKKQYEMCENYSYLGSRTDGGFAEYVAVPEWNLIELPDNISYEAAAMFEPLAVAVHGMRRASLKKGDTVAVCGLGTIGQLLAMVLKDMGCNVYAIGNKQLQKDAVCRFGVKASDYCNSLTEDVTSWLQHKTDGNGVDAFFECVGKNETVRLAIENTCAGGQIVFYGNPYSEMLFDKDVYWRILRRQLHISGTWNSSFLHEKTDDWNYLLEKVASGEIKPEQLITHRYSLEDLEQGFQIMRDKREEYIKIMCSITSGLE